MNIGDIRLALAAAARSLPGLNALHYEPDAFSLPLFTVCEADIRYDQAFSGGMQSVEFKCRLYVSAADDRSGQEALDGYVSYPGPNSIKQYLELSRGVPGVKVLGGTADDLHVTGVTGPRRYVIGDKSVYGVELSVKVIGA